MKRPIVLLLASISLGAGGCVTHIDAGHVGVMVDSCQNGGVEDAPVGVGYHTTGPCTNIVEFPVFQQNLILTKNPQEGSTNDDSINVTSSEGLPISTDVSLSYSVDTLKAPHVYGKFRKSLEEIQTVYMRQTVRQAMQDTFAKYTAQQLYSDKKEIARAEIQGILTIKLGADGFNVTQFTINETRPPESVIDAIKAKVAMTQQAQQAEQEVKKTEAVGRQKVATAEAEATATKLRADAEAYANQKIASSLSPVLVDYKKVGKWDGKLPQVSGGSAATMMSLGTSK
jgi:prohibitin 2